MDKGTKDFCDFLKSVSENSDKKEGIDNLKNLILETTDEIITKEFIDNVHILFPLMDTEITEGKRIGRVIYHICEYLDIDKIDGCLKYVANYLDAMSLPRRFTSILLKAEGTTCEKWSTDQTYDRG